MKLPRTIRKLRRLPNGTHLTINNSKLEFVKQKGKWVLKRRRIEPNQTGAKR